MNYSKVWEKVLAEDEKVIYEFSISNKYINFSLIFFLLFSIILSFVLIGIPLLIYVLFYYLFYIKVANAYAFTNKRILIHQGWLSTKLTSIDYYQITDTYVLEPFLARIFTKSGHLVVNTAGTSLFEVYLRYVDYPYEVKKKLDLLKDEFLKTYRGGKKI